MALCDEIKRLNLVTFSCQGVGAKFRYGESCAVLRHNCPCTITLLLPWDCPFKRLFSSQTYVYDCLIIFSPLKESHEFNKICKDLKSQDDQKSPEDQQESETNKSPEVQQESGRLPRARTRNMKTKGNLQESGSPQESRKTAKSQESRSSRVWRTGTI